MMDFFKRLSIFSAILFGGYMLLTFFLSDSYYPAAYWAMVPFFFLVISLSKFLFLKLSLKNKPKYTESYFVVTVFRFMIYLLALVGYTFAMPEEAIVFIITFFVFYFAFTFFEVMFIHRWLK